VSETSGTEGNEQIPHAAPDDVRTCFSIPKGPPMLMARANDVTAEERQLATLVRRMWQPRVVVISRAELSPLLTEAEAAEQLHVNPTRMQDWRRREVGPPWFHLGGRVIRYRQSDLAMWRTVISEWLLSQGKDPRTLPYSLAME
jgi:hypothetical protein